MRFIAYRRSFVVSLFRKFPTFSQHSSFICTTSSTTLYHAELITSARSFGAFSVPHEGGDIMLVNAAVFYLAQGYPLAQPFVVTYKPGMPDNKMSVSRLGRAETV